MRARPVLTVPIALSPLTKVKLINELNAREAELGVSEAVSWHAEYKDSAWVFIGTCRPRWGGRCGGDEESAGRLCGAPCRARCGSFALGLPAPHRRPLLSPPRRRAALPADRGGRHLCVLAVSAPPFPLLCPYSPAVRLLMVCFRYGEVVNINLVRDKKTGKSKGFCFLCYEDQRSTVLAVDNFNGIKVSGGAVWLQQLLEHRITSGRGSISCRPRSTLC